MDVAGSTSRAGPHSSVVSVVENDGVRLKAELSKFQRSLEIDRVYSKGGAALEHTSERPGIVRILTWNIDRGSDIALIARRLAEIQPDIACLQEVDWGNERTGAQDVLALLADRCGMEGLYGIEFLELPSVVRTRLLAGGGATGNAILSRFRAVSSFRVDLPEVIDWQHDAENPRLPRSVRHRIGREPRIGARFGLCARFEIAGRNVIVCSAHLEDKFGGVRGRWSQFTALSTAVEARRGSGIGIIAGDFNTFDSRLARLFSADDDATALGKPAQQTEAEWWKTVLLPATGYADPFEPSDWTFRIPPLFRAKLDWITVNGAAVRAHGVARVGGSDHRPLWADLDLS